MRGFCARCRRFGNPATGLASLSTGLHFYPYLEIDCGLSQNLQVKESRPRAAQVSRMMGTSLNAITAFTKSINATSTTGPEAYSVFRVKILYRFTQLTKSRGGMGKEEKVRSGVSELL